MTGPSVPARVRGTGTAGVAVAAAGLTAAGPVRAGALGMLGPSWSLSFVVAGAVGTWACAFEPGNRPAVRLLVSGWAALTWLAASVWLAADGARLTDPDAGPVADQVHDRLARLVEQVDGTPGRRGARMARWT